MANSRKMDNEDLPLKWKTFTGMYIGYTLAIFNRKSFSFALPAIMASLGMNKNEAGLISSSQNLAYTISKFFGGILADTVNVKYLFCFGLFGSGLLTISLAGFRSAFLFAIILFLQGIFQGGCWPACAKILKRIFSDVEFGTWYSVLNTGMNVACCLGPIVVAYVIALQSWSTVFLVSGIAAVMGSLLSYMLIESPSPELDGGDSSSSISSGNRLSDTQLRGRGTWKDLLRSPFMWVVSTCYLVVFMARTAALDWGQLYIIHELNHSQYVGSMFISCMEVGGVIGSIIAGYIADRLVNNAQHTATINGTPRMTVAIAFVAILTSSLHMFLFCMSSGSSEFWIAMVGFLMGFGAYGPISIYGVMSMEASPTHLQGTSHAIVSLAANIGAILAGLPFSLVAERWKWKGAFLVMEVTLVVTIFIKLFTSNLEYKMVPTKKKIQ